MKRNLFGRATPQSPGTGCKSPKASAITGTLGQTTPQSPGTQSPGTQSPGTEEYCPRCNATLNLQKGYSSMLPNWICRGCGEMLINPSLDTESDIIWVCDGCGATLNIQEGFNEEKDVFICNKCGYSNKITPEEVYLSEDEFQMSLKDPLKGLRNEALLELMEYEEIRSIDGREDVILVKDSNSGKLYVKKYLRFYDADVINYLKENPIEHMPKIQMIFEATNNLIVIEEYIAGSTVESILKNGPLDAGRAVEIICSLCDTLSELHGLDQPIIHRDLKPSNIMITPDNEVYLLDINAAKRYDFTEKEDTVLIGTKYYAAPEQYGFGFTASSLKTDIYALGVIFNRMITGKIPKECRASEPYWTIIEKCISLEPDSRYSAQELKNVLQNLDR